jgi:hypothetical protein
MSNTDKKTEPTVKQSANGTLLITFPDGQQFTFHKPKGRDLIPMERAVSENMTEVESLAILLSQLQDGDKMSSDQWLDDVDLVKFKKVGQLVSEYFLS